MAAETGFKQQCPSCEAQVAVKDKGLIGKKIDCPKCKYRFVVEDPTKNAKKSKEKDLGKETKKPIPPKAGPKPKPKKAVEDEDDFDDDEDEKPVKGKGKAKAKKTGKGGSKKLLIGLGLAGVIAILLGVAGFFLFMGGSDTTKPSVTPGSGACASVGKKDTTETKPVEEPKKEDPKPVFVPVVMVGEPSNILPNDTEAVINVAFPEFLKSEIGRAAFETPGAFYPSDFEKKLGFPVDRVERFIAAGNFTKDWFFFVLRFSKNVNFESIKSAYGLVKPPESPLLGQEFWITQNNWLTHGSPFRINANPAAGNQTAALQVGDRPLAVRLFDPQTLVLADLEVLKDVLKEKGQPKKLTQPFVAPTTSETLGTTPATGTGGTTTPPAGNPSTNPGNAPNPAPAPTSGTSPAPGANPSTPAPPMTPPPTQSNGYLTINPRLKALLDRVETKPPFLFSLAADMKAYLEINKDLLKTVNIPGANMTTAMNEVGDLGFSLQMKDTIVGKVASDYSNEAIAKESRKQMRDSMGLASTLLGTSLQIEVKFTDSPPDKNAKPGQSGNPMPPAPPPNQPPKDPNKPDGDEKPPSLGALTIDIAQSEKIVLITLDLRLDQTVFDRIRQAVAQFWVYTKGQSEMAFSRPQVHELARATKLYRDSKKLFPRGTLVSPEGAGRNASPDNRLSWLVDLLPNLGQEGLHKEIRMGKSWRDPENITAATALIPQFLDSRSGPSDWRIPYPGLPMQIGATHYVGVAGVGLDAADYAADNPVTANKRGIIGYDRQTSLDDVKDGLSNTMLMIEIPWDKNVYPQTAHVGGWMAGGGSTVRGVPEKKSVEPFLSGQAYGKRATIILMADGSVRTVTEAISDDVFKAMATINGGEKINDLDKIAPILEMPGTSELTTGIAPAINPVKAPEKKVTPSTKKPNAEPVQGK